ncbi:hypothetical protein D3C76_1038770 [compost metagenome]
MQSDRSTPSWAATTPIAMFEDWDFCDSKADSPMPILEPPVVTLLHAFRPIPIFRSPAGEAVGPRVPSQKLKAISSHRAKSIPNALMWVCDLVPSAIWLLSVANAPWPMAITSLFTAPPKALKPTSVCLDPVVVSPPALVPMAVQGPPIDLLRA